MRDKKRHNWRIFAFFCVLIFCAAQPSMALVVSELMYHPVEAGGIPSGAENLEFIELYNNRAVFEDLSGCAFTNGIEYTFPAGTILAGKQYLVVAKDPAAVLRPAGAGMERRRHTNRSEISRTRHRIGKVEVNACASKAFCNI